MNKQILIYSSTIKPGHETNAMKLLRLRGGRSFTGKSYLNLLAAKFHLEHGDDVTVVGMGGDAWIIPELRKMVAEGTVEEVKHQDQPYTYTFKPKKETKMENGDNLVDKLFKRVVGLLDADPVRAAGVEKLVKQELGVYLGSAYALGRELEAKAQKKERQKANTAAFEAHATDNPRGQ